MKLRCLIAMAPVAIVAMALVGCSVSTDLEPETKDSGGPVKAAPLSGTIAGKAFQGKVAVVTQNTDSADVVISDRDATCSSQPDAELRVLLHVNNWAPGLSYNLDFGRSATFYVKSDNFNALAVSGRVEVSGSGQTLGVRINAEQNGSVEGTVPVVICK